MERSEVSSHEVRVYLALKGDGGWMTSKEIAARAGVAGRTARAHALKFVRLGLVDQAEVFPAHRYRLSEHANNRNTAYLRRIEQAREVLGLEEETCPS